MADPFDPTALSDEQLAVIVGAQPKPGASLAATPQLRPVSDMSDHELAAIANGHPLPVDPSAPVQSWADLEKYGEVGLKDLPVIGGALQTGKYLPDTTQFEKEHPVGSKIVGGLAAGVGTAPLAAFKAGRSALGLVGDTFLERGARAMLPGAAIGGADAYTRGQDPTTGALFGGGIAAAAPVVGNMVGAGTGKLADAIAGPAVPAELKGLPSAAQRFLRDYAERDLASPGATAAKLKELGPEGFLYEAGPHFQASAENLAAHGVPDVPNAVHARAADALPRTEGYLDKAFGPNVNIPQYVEGLENFRKQASDPAYQAWHSTTVPMTPELSAIAQNPYVKAALPQATKFAQAENKSVLDASGNPTAGTWDYIKQALYDDEIRAGPGTNEARIIANTRHGLTDAVDNYFANQSNPQLQGIWKNARESYALPSEMLHAFDAGQNALKRGVNVDQFNLDYSRYSGPAKTAYNQGYRASASDALGDSTTNGSQQRSLLLTPNAQAKVKIMLQNAPQKADDLINSIRSERIFKGDDQATIQNSRTAARQFVEDAQGKSTSAEPTIVKYLRGITEEPLNPFGYLGLSKPILEAQKDRALSNARESMSPLLTLQGPQRNRLVDILAQYGQQPMPSEKVSPLVNALTTYGIAGPGSQVFRQSNLPQR